MAEPLSRADLQKIRTGWLPPRVVAPHSDEPSVDDEPSVHVAARHGEYLGLTFRVTYTLGDDGEVNGVSYASITQSGAKGVDGETEFTTQQSPDAPDSADVTIEDIRGWYRKKGVGRSAQNAIDGLTAAVIDRHSPRHSSEYPSGARWLFRRPGWEGPDHTVLRRRQSEPPRRRPK